MKPKVPHFSKRQQQPKVWGKSFPALFVQNNLPNNHFFPLFNLMMCLLCVPRDTSPVTTQTHCNTPSWLFQSKPNNMSLYPAGAFSCCIYELAALYIFILVVLNNCRRVASLSPKLLQSHLLLWVIAVGLDWHIIQPVGDRTLATLLQLLRNTERLWLVKYAQAQLSYHPNIYYNCFVCFVFKN